MSKPVLPPLDLLEPFEAAARLGSFTRAAQELSVTQSAISQRVRKLEDLLEVKLFERQHRAIELTPDGRELLNGVSVALRHLTSAAVGVRQQAGRPRVTLGVDTSVAQLWLMPRVQQVLKEHPAFDVDLTVTDVETDVLNADVAILHGDGNWPGYTAHLLFHDQIFPVCAPSYLHQHPVHHMEDLQTAELIDLDYVHWNWMNWRIWLTEAGVPQAKARIVLRTNSYTTQLEAARAGVGIALGWAALLEDDLETGKLLRPVDHAVSTGFGYYLLVREGAGADALALSGQLLRDR